MRLILYIFFFITVFTSGTHAQYLFNNLTPKDGLSTREIRSLLQDKEGFIWIGTMNGLNRFDGSHVLAINQETANYPAGMGLVVTCITETPSGLVWFGTNIGAATYDKTTQQITEVSFDSGNNKIFRPNITQTLHDNQKRQWVSTTEGIFIEDKNGFKRVSKIYPFAKDLDSVYCQHSAFAFDSVRNMMWMASNLGLFGLDLTNNKLYSSKSNPDKLPIYNDDRLNAIAVERNGDLWLGSVSGNSLNHYNVATREYEKLKTINNNPEWALMNGCNNLFFDKENRLWISTWLFTSFVRQPNGIFDHIRYDKDLPYSIGYGLVNDAMQDRYGNIWLGTINGVSKLNASNFVEDIIKTPNHPFFFPINFSNVNTVLADTGDIWWLAKMEGLLRYDTRTKNFKLFAPYDYTERSNEFSTLTMIDGEIWCGARNGVNIFNTKTKKYRLFPFPGNKDNSLRPVQYILYDRNQNVWIGVYGWGVYRYNTRTKESVYFDGKSDTAQNFHPTNTAAALEAADGKIWLSNGYRGIMIYDPVTKRFNDHPDSLLRKDYAASMLQEKDGSIWVATVNHGMLKFDPNGKLLDSISRQDGLPIGEYRKLCIDKAGRLWTKSREWLFCIQPSTKQVTRVMIDVTYSFNDHWIGLTMVGDRLLATMLDNIVVIRPEKFQRNASSTLPLISSFKVFENDTPIDSKKSIELSWKQNFFTIDFSSPFHREDATIQYAYKLEGFNDDWVYSGRRLTAAYTNVPSGSYRFLLKTTDANGRWNTQMRVLNIHISPPFWNSIWFRTLMAIAALALLWWIYQLFKKRKRQQNIESTIDYFANSVYGENSVNEICWDIARNCISQLQFEDCVVYLLDKKSNKLIQKAAYGPKNPKGHEIMNPLELEVGNGIVGTVAATGKPLLINDTSRDSRYVIDDEPRLSELAIPIAHDGKVIGVIDSEHSRRNFFSDEHVKAISTIASISANKIAEAQAEAQAKENEIKLLEINKMLAESQLMALRAQMNPHFVFNCLNSIQECIVTQKYGEASKYLNKFSKLFRMVLNNSGKNLVTMNEEKTVLELYLELEDMRFEKSFSFEIVVDEDLEADEILIPSMLIQPYVENALWHGLMHKEGERKLLVDFKRINEDIFRCIIDDNGIGREKSFELKAMQSKAKRHESKGLKISKDRIDVLGKQGYHATLEIIDKKNERGEALGTTVIIELSTFLKN